MPRKRKGSCRSSKDAMRKKKIRATESQHQRESRLENARLAEAARRQRETSEERQRRLENARVAQASRRRRESSEKR